MEAELAKLAAVESRLRALIQALVQRHAARGEPLSWRLMFEIEDEAMTLLAGDAGLDAHYVRMFRVPPAPPERRREEPVGIADAGAMHTVLWMIQEAYFHRH
ncbi:MAG TPA: hypothetical protein VEC01_06645 [Noviherbaspirillum sp.]|uniref:DUF2471 family protein n=1 Tax=Noviherbaspirillum sp. TaxID=1926288 RepID=UPI002D595787|nr:hypothetical protein [Noviherbaspirillum sp.]HYD94986.1 hypothetical protein [Noviherbaspirillum sp.]